MTPDADALMRLLPVTPHLLALGEPTHGEEALLATRNALFRHLVERHGYRTIAIESDCLLGLAVDDHVTSGAGTLDEVVEHGISHGWGAFPANRELVRWMRAYNEDRPAPERVRFAGFDGPLEITHAASPRRALLALHAAVDPDLRPCSAATIDDLLGPDERWTEPAAMRDPSRSVGCSPDAERLRLIADDLVALLDTQTPVPARARLYGRTATGLLRYHRWMADATPARLSRLLGQRASMMAGNLLALADRGPLLVHAHNAHLQRGRSSIRMGGAPVHWWSAGAIVAARLGDRYAVVPTAVGTIPHRGVGAPPPGTVEGHLYARSADGGAAGTVVDPAALPGGLVPRASPWFGYAPLDPAHLPDIDGLVFVRDA